MIRAEREKGPLISASWPALGAAFITIDKPNMLQRAAKAVIGFVRLGTIIGERSASVRCYMETRDRWHLGLR